MKRNTANYEKTVRVFFYIFMLIMLTGFIAAEVYYPSERTEGVQRESIIYQGSFYWEKADGTKEEIGVPGEYDLPANETMVIVSQLPEDYCDNAIAIRAALQDISIYIDDELRLRYDTRNTRPFGKNSASCFVFAQTSEKDAGKQLRIELTSHTINYSGVVNTVYAGDKSEIWRYIFNDNKVEMIMAFFILFSGFIAVIFSIALGIVYKIRMEMEYLGWCMIIGSIWLLGESKLKQLWIPNLSVMAIACFVVVMLCPIPFLAYMDAVQKGRYSKWYHWIGRISILNFLFATVMHVCGRLDYIETLPIAHMVLFITVAVVSVTFILDIRRKKIAEYYLILIGIVATMIGIVIESIAIYVVNSVYGVFLGTGLILLLFMNILHTVNNLHKLEKEKQKEEIEEKKRQTEQITLKMLRTLSMTLEKKDEYYSGHSYRVAQYSGMIAKELGWSSEEIRNLENAACMHDVGMVGISGVLLNKPFKLTEEEFAHIQTHTIIGADILKDITVIDHVVDAARSHHERYDGKGYPDGLFGEEIPIFARIIALTDSYDAMKSRRIYRDALSDEEIYQEIKQNSGKQFDPEIADTFLKMLREGKVELKESLGDHKEDLETETEKFLSDIMNTMKKQSDSYDYLTGLPMRSRGEIEITQYMQEHNGCLVFLDMDNLKSINDIYGHKAGDRALKLLGRIISEVGESLLACRFGGDEFVMFIDKDDQKSASETIDRLFERFRQEKDEDMEIRRASLSAGLCLTQKGDTFEECYLKADKALYYVKQNGKNHYAFYRQIQREIVPEASAGRDLKNVARALRETGNYTGAMDTDARSFARIYEYVNSLGERYKYVCYLVMVSMHTKPDQAEDMEKIEYAMDCMEKSIRKKIRKVDVCTRYSTMQHLIILFEPEESKIPEVMERIFSEFYNIHENNEFKLGYEYIPMTEKKI